MTDGPLGSPFICFGKNLLLARRRSVIIRKRWPLPAFLLVAIIIVGLADYLFAPPLPDLRLPRADLRLAAWLGVTWSMDEQEPGEIRDLAKGLLARDLDEIYVYVSYLRADDAFNSTYGQAETFAAQMKRHAPGDAHIGLDRGADIGRASGWDDHRQPIAFGTDPRAGRPVLAIRSGRTWI